MTKTEQIFTMELLQRAIDTQQLFGINMRNFTDKVNKFGAVSVAKEIIKKHGVSQSFNLLCDEGRLDLSMEELVTLSKFGELFTDAEVNYCFELLCENDYYKLK